MATQPQQQPPRTWLRLPSIARPAPPPAATPTPGPPPPPRPALPVPAFRPTTQPQPPQTQPQESTNARQAVEAPPAPAPATTGVASVPTSPIRTSVPSSPVRPRVSGPTSSVPSSPVRPRFPGPTSSVPSSPTPKPALSSTVTSPAGPKPTPTVEPRPVVAPRTIEPAVVQNKTPPQTRPKPTTPPPSPLSLPPARVVKPSGSESESRIPLEAEQKTVVVQKTVGSERDFTDNVIKSSIASLRTQEHHSKAMEGKEKGHHKKLSSDSDDSGMRIITIAGENRGAFMEVIHSPNKNSATFEGNSHFLHKKKEHNGSSSSSSGGDEANPKKKDKSHKLGKAMGTNPMSAFMNSNVQGVNNSIVFNSTCTHHDPGVHLMLSRKPGGNGFHIKEHANGFQG